MSEVKSTSNSYCVNNKKERNDYGAYLGLPVTNCGPGGAFQVFLLTSKANEESKDFRLGRPIPASEAIQKFSSKVQGKRALEKFRCVI